MLRDITERVIIASKGRFDRALSAKQRQARGLPSVNSSSSDEFMAATLDVWEMLPESAKRVQHPAPFPVELPERLIHLYTYENDLVLDPFMGSGSTLVAAARLGRRYAGYDLDPAYVEIARDRFAAAQPATQSPGETVGASDDFQVRASREGKAAQAIAERVIEEAGFKIVARNTRPRGLPLVIAYVAEDNKKRSWYFDVSGGFTTTRGGLLRSDVAWKALGRAHVLKSKGFEPVVFLTSHLPRRGTESDSALRAAGTGAFFDAVEMLSDEGRSRLSSYARAGRSRRPLAGFWTDKDISTLT